MLGLTQMCTTHSPTAAMLFKRILDLCGAFAHMLLSSEGRMKKDVKKLPDPDLLNSSSSVQTVPLCKNAVMIGVLERCQTPPNGLVIAEMETQPRFFAIQEQAVHCTRSIMTESK